MEEAPTEAVQTDKPISRWWAVLAILVGVVGAVLVGKFESKPIAKAAGSSTACIIIAAVIFWDSRRERWFWPYILFAVILHGLLVSFAAWPGDPPTGHKDPFIIIGIVDLFAMIGLGWIASRLTRASSVRAASED